MIPVLFVALGMQVQITEADVPLILDAVAEYATTSYQSWKGRTVFVASETNDTFREAIPGGMEREIRPTGEHFSMASSDQVALHCPEPQERSSCDVAENGVLLTVAKIRESTRPEDRREPGGHALNVVMRWNDETSTQEENLTLVVARSEDDWSVVADLYMVY